MSATIVQRGLARIIDALLVCLLAYLAGLPFGHYNPFDMYRPQDLGSTAGRAVAVVIGLVILVYEPVMLAARRQTVGKVLVGTIVRVENDAPLTIGRVLRRHLPSLLIRTAGLVTLVLFLMSPHSGEQSSGPRVVQGPGGQQIVLPPDDDAFNDGLRVERAETTAGYVGLALVALTGVNAVMLVLRGTSLFDRLAGTTVIEDPEVHDPPLGALLDKVS